MDYISIYEAAGNIRDSNGGMHIPIFACAQSLGDVYARSVSVGMTKVFSLSSKSSEKAQEEVYAYLLDVCDEKVKDEDHGAIYDRLVMGLAKGTMSVFALSYKHKIFGGDLGRRQRLPLDKIRSMAEEVVAHAEIAGKQEFCFWLDQILGQRRPYSERRWVDHGLLPYAAFDVVIFPYSETEKGAWLTVERLLAEGRSPSTSHPNTSTLVRRDRDEGGQDSLMRAASAIACGVIDDLRGSNEDKLDIVRWTLELLDISQFMQENHYFNKRTTDEDFNAEETPWNSFRLASVMINLEILPGELCRSVTPSSRSSWDHEAGLLSRLISNDCRVQCDGTWLSRGVTRSYATAAKGRFLFVQHIRREARPSLVIAAVVTKQGNTKSNRVLAYMAASFDEFFHPEAKRVHDEKLDFIYWAPVAQFATNNRLDPVQPLFLEQFNGKWQCG